MENWTGVLRLAVRHKEARTILAEVYQQGASKVTPPIYLDDPSQPCFYMMNLGGGYVGGDCYKAEIYVDERAQMLLTTQSSTKIFKTLTCPAIQETSIIMERDSYLEYMPDPIIAYQHAQYLQNTVIRMKRRAALIYGDIITPGWSPDGSLFRYNRLKLKTFVYYDGELAVLDHLQLRPEVHDVEGLGILEGHTHFGTMTVIGEKATSDFIEQMSDHLNACTGNFKIGLSALNLPGFSLRVLAISTQQIEAIFEVCRRYVREQWFGKKAISFRKY